MRRKVLAFAVTAMVALNVGLWAAPQPANAASAPWGDCGCAIGPDGELYGFCTVFLEVHCESDNDCKCGPPPDP